MCVLRFSFTGVSPSLRPHLNVVEAPIMTYELWIKGIVHPKLGFNPLEEGGSGTSFFFPMKGRIASCGTEHRTRLQTAGVLLRSVRKIVVIF